VKLVSCSRCFFFIDSLCVLFLYVDNYVKIWTVSFSTKKGPGKKKKTFTSNKSWLLCLDCVVRLDTDNSDANSTTDYETLVSQRKYPL
jgi:hypothetical protein